MEKAYASSGGTLILNTFFDDATSNNGQGTSDKLIVKGSVVTGTGGATTIIITPTYNTGHMGVTQGDGIKIIDVGGTSTNDAFKLAGPLTVGPYQYGLNKGSVDSSWYLRSIGINPAVGAYLASQTAATEMFMQSLSTRQSASALSHDTNLWLRSNIKHSNNRSVHNYLKQQ